MTNFKQEDIQHLGRARTKHQQEAYDAKWLAAGFEYRWLRGQARLHYTRPGDFPTFEVTPGIVTNDTGTHEGLVARHPRSGREILFPYGMAPAEIKSQLDVQTYEIIAHDAEIDDEPIDWPAAGEEIDFDSYMAGGRWVRS